MAAAYGNAEIENERDEEPEPAAVEENGDQYPSRNRDLRSRVTQAEFYSSLMSIRGDFNNVFVVGALTQNILSILTSRSRQIA